MHGPVLYALRESSGLSLVEAERATGCRTAAIVKYENDEKPPGDTYLLRLSTICGMKNKVINSLSRFDDENIENGKQRLLRRQIILLRILKFKLEGIPIFNEEEAEKYRGK